MHLRLKFLFFILFFYFAFLFYFYLFIDVVLVYSYGCHHFHHHSTGNASHAPQQGLFLKFSSPHKLCIWAERAATATNVAPNDNLICIVSCAQTTYTYAQLGLSFLYHLFLISEMCTVKPASLVLVAKASHHHHCSQYQSYVCRNFLDNSKKKTIPIYKLREK